MEVYIERDSAFRAIRYLIFHTKKAIDIIGRHLRNDGLDTTATCLSKNTKVASKADLVHIVHSFPYPKSRLDASSTTSSASISKMILRLANKQNSKRATIVLVSIGV